MKSIIYWYCPLFWCKDCCWDYCSFYWCIVTIRIVPSIHNFMCKLNGYLEQKEDIDSSWLLHFSNLLVEAWLSITHFLYLLRWNNQPLVIHDSHSNSKVLFLLQVSIPGTLFYWEIPGNSCCGIVLDLKIFLVYVRILWFGCCEIL